MIYKPDFERAKDFWRKFWKQEYAGRPLVCVKAPKRGMEQAKFSWTPADSYRACMNGTIDKSLNEFEKYLQSTYFGGEAIPSLDVQLGPDQYAGFLGAKIKTRDDFYTTWAHPIVDDWADFEVKIDKSQNSYMDILCKNMRAAAEFGKEKFIVNMPDLHSNMDALSALRGPQDLCFDIMDTPEEVHRILNDVRGTYTEIFDILFQAGNMAQTGSTSWAPLYCDSGKFAVVQCDFSCMLSPNQAREFVIPAIEEEANFLDYSMYHYDGKEALGHLDDVLAIDKINCVQWVPGDGQPRSIEWMDLLKKIQKASKSLWIFDWTADEIKKHYRELDPSKVVFSLDVASQDEAEDLLEFLEKNG